MLTLYLLHKTWVYVFDLQKKSSARSYINPPSPSYGALLIGLVVATTWVRILKKNGFWGVFACLDCMGVRRRHKEY
jgi:hypothetical protein